MSIVWTRGSNMRENQMTTYGKPAFAMLTIVYVGPACQYRSSARTAPVERVCSNRKRDETRIPKSVGKKTEY
jgi:hypothetical protein